MRDFTIKTYNELLTSIVSKNAMFWTFKDSIIKKPDNYLILRHDVEKLNENALQFAHIQAENAIKGTYYFRIVPQSYNPEIIKEIASLGHEIGYHYETLAACKGDVDKAYVEFCRNLEKFRNIVPVSTICMHGSPMSKYDNRDIWKKYDYRKLGIIGEPYFDIDFNDVLYLTDTGRRWDGRKFSIRDKVVIGRKSEDGRPKTEDGRRKTEDGSRKTAVGSYHRFHTTFDIIAAAENDELPDRIMFTFHPQRWSDKPLPWLKELVWQNVKNRVKGIVLRKR